MEEAPENGKESSHSAHANGMNIYTYTCTYVTEKLHGFNLRSHNRRIIRSAFNHSGVSYMKSPYEYV